MTTQQVLSSSLLLLLLLFAGADSISLPLQLSPSYIPQGGGVCPSEAQRQETRYVIRGEVSSLLQEYIRSQVCNVGLTADTAVSSCADIPPVCGSGMRHVTTADGKTEQIYCDTNPPFDTTTSWMRLEALDMDNASHTCPGQWVETTDPDTGVRACGRDLTMEQSIAEATFSTNGISYSSVCGRITGYQFGATEAFTTDQAATLRDPYVDGVSVTNNDHSEHIWTFAAARAQGDETSSAVCPCTNPSLHQGANIYIPQFVGQDYFCETGVTESTAHDSTFYFDYPLWDGEDCSGSSTCCEFNGPPWFCKTLSTATTQDIAVRIMNFASEGQKLDGEDTPIQTLHLYVQ